MFPHVIAEVCMGCRFVSSTMLQCYPWRCRGAWWMLSSRPWFFFESRCLGCCLWCNIAVPGRRSCHRSLSQWCWHYMCVSFSVVTCSSLYPDFHFNQLVPEACIVVLVWSSIPYRLTRRSKGAQTKRTFGESLKEKWVCEYRWWRTWVCWNEWKRRNLT